MQASMNGVISERIGWGFYLAVPKIGGIPIRERVESTMRP